MKQSMKTKAYITNKLYYKNKEYIKPAMDIKTP